jgi:SAM-dependent methyltransferase
MQQPVDYPDFVARFYDVIYAKVRGTAEGQGFLKRIVECPGPVLEIGVGTGRLFTEALDAGADIYGIDVNQSMIERLQAKLAPEQRHRVAVQDARCLQLDQRFDLVVAPFRVFGHFIEVDDQLSALCSVAEHLTPGGRFLFDLYVPNPKLLAEGLDRVNDFDGEYEPGKRLQRFVSMNADVVSQLSHITMEFVWEEDGEERQATWRLPLRFFYRYELEHLVHRSALELEAIWGDYDEGPLGPDAKELVVVCRRPAG